MTALFVAICLTVFLLGAALVFIGALVDTYIIQSGLADVLFQVGGFAVLFSPLVLAGYFICCGLLKFFGV